MHQVKDKGYSRIIKNSGVLYIRLLLAMAVNLYTSRLILSALGVEDFGIYHAVAGFVAILGFLQGAMTSASQRYLAFDLGDSNGKNLTAIFTTSLQVHGLLALSIILVAETGGYLFVGTQLTIPEARLTAALSAYHFAVASLALSVITVPFTAMLIAHERMGVFAGISILDIFLKLGAVLMVSHLSGDKLVAYAMLIFLVGSITFTFYILCNRIIFPTVKLKWYWNKDRFSSMMKFTGWSTLGYLSSALNTQGSNVLLNIFFNPAVNAGRAISIQANSALYSFIQNIQLAVSPQIIKHYASGNQVEMHRLVSYASKYYFYLFLLVALPIALHADAILSLWLGNVPPYAAIFLKLSILASLIESLSTPLITSAQATGRIKSYQIIVGGILLLSLPFSFILLHRWQRPELVVWVFVIFTTLALFARIFILRRLTGLNVQYYLVNVVLRSFVVGVVSAAVAYLLLPSSSSLIAMIVGIVVCIVSTALIIFAIGLDGTEKRYVSEFIRITVIRTKSRRL